MQNKKNALDYFNEATKIAGTYELNQILKKNNSPLANYMPKNPAPSNSNATEQEPVLIRKTSIYDDDAEELTPAGEAAFREGFASVNDEDEYSNALAKIRTAVKDAKTPKVGDMFRQSVQNMPAIGEKKSENDQGKNWLEKHTTQIKNAVNRMGDGISKFGDYRKENGTINAISKTLNDYGLLDDVTNKFFKTYDYIQQNPGVVPVTANKVWNIVNPQPMMPSDIAMKSVISQTNRPLKAINDSVHSLIAKRNYEENQEVDLNQYYNKDGYINDQNTKDSIMKDLKYGQWDMYNNGCELIAVYNSLNALDNRNDIRDIANDFEKKGQTLYGYFGTSPYAVGDYFREKGYTVKTFEGDNAIKNLSLPKADSYILSFWNNDRFSSAIHTVSIKEQDDGTYIVYNSDGRSADVVNNLNEYLNEERKYGKRVPLVLHCISKD